MNALLIYPKMPETFWNMRLLAKALGKKSDYPPLGIITLAAFLPSEWSIRIIDLNDKKLSQKDLVWADLVFISAMSVQIDSVREIISRCKEASKTIVAGGPLFTHDHQLFPEVDHFVLNEAELTLPDFLTDLANNKAKKIYSSKQYADLSKTPVPRYDLIDLSRYAYGIIQYSRGCPFQCDFCDVTQLYGQKTRTKSADQVIEELEAMGDLNKLNLILFADDNLIGNKFQLKNELLPRLIEWRSKTQPSVAFGTQVSINLADDEEMMTLMLEAGFRHLFVGIETPETESLKASLKNQNLKIDLAKNIKVLHQKGFIVTGGFIVGFDNDKPDIFERQASFIQQTGIVISTINILKAPVGTTLAARMKSEGRLLNTTDFDEQKINFIPAMPIEMLYKGYQELLSDVLLPDGVFLRMEKFFKDFKGAQVTNRISRPLKTADILTFFRILWSVGLTGSVKGMYWRFLLHGLKKYPKQLDLVFLFIVLAMHFHAQNARFTNYQKSEEHEELVKKITKNQANLDQSKK